MRKSLSSIGSSLGIILDKPILEALAIDKTSILNLSIEGGAIVLRAAPPRSANSREEFDEWARSLAVRVGAAGTDLSTELQDEMKRFEATLPTFLPNAKGLPKDAHERLVQVVQRIAAAQPPPPPPIITRVVARAILEELSQAQGTFRDITAARPFANATRDVVASVIWFLIARAYAETPPDGVTIRPLLERYRSRGEKVPETIPDSVARVLQDGVVTLRLTPIGGEYLHELRIS